MQKYKELKEAMHRRAEKKQVKTESAVEKQMFELYYKCYCDAVKDLSKKGKSTTSVYKTTKSGEVVDVLSWHTKNIFNRKLNSKIFRKTLNDTWGLVGLAGAGVFAYGLFTDNIEMLKVGMLSVLAVAGRSVMTVTGKRTDRKIELYGRYVNSKPTSQKMKDFASKAEEHYNTKHKKQDECVLGKI